MKKKGFTLIELLAVIVILAIIALIATPIVMNVIESSRKGAAERSYENYIRAVETAIAEERINGPIVDGTYEVMSDGSLCKGTISGTDCTGTKLSVEVSGTKPLEGSTVEIENGLIKKGDTTTLKIGDYTVKYDTEQNKVVATKTAGGSTTKVVYRWSGDQIKLEDQIDPTDTTFKADPSELDENYYLKHVVENNIVKESYVCVKFNGVDQEICVRGGTDENGNSYYNENKSKLEGLQDWDCDADYSNCYYGSVNLGATSDGYVNVSDDYGGCNVDGDGDGSSYCGSW